MMDLITSEKNVRGHKVSVDSGALYDVDKDGIIRNVADADADELLRIPSWKLYAPGTPPAPPARAPVKPQGIALIGSDGKPIERQLPPPPPAPTTAPVAPVTEPVGAVNPPGTTTEVTAAATAPATPEVPPAPAPSPNTEPSGQPQWVIPAPGTDWPDPVAAMPMDYLKLMADAYGVRYAPNIGEAAKAGFIERIEKAMYESTPATTPG